MFDAYGRWGTITDRQRNAMSDTILMEINNFLFRVFFLEYLPLIRSVASSNFEKQLTAFLAEAQIRESPPDA